MEAEHQKEQEELNAFITAETSRLNDAVEKERNERSSAEEQIVETVEKVFGSFQEGLAAFQS